MPPSFRFGDDLWFDAMDRLDPAVAEVDREKQKNKITVLAGPSRKKTIHDNFVNICNVFLFDKKWQQSLENSIESLPADVFDKDAIKNFWQGKLENKDQSDFMIFWLILSYAANK
jgi:hypothetical protein